MNNQTTINFDWAAVQKYAESAQPNNYYVPNPYYRPYPSRVCPHCGYCPCCGRGGTPFGSYPNWPTYDVTWTIQGTNDTGSYQINGLAARG